MVEKYFEKVYAGFLGMNAGIRLGAPVENWTYDRIRDSYGEITGYVKEYKNFAADDDANGPVFFLRALLDDAINREPTPQDIARAWLNYTREGIGMFWWGGYGVSTEHTAYLNLKQGIPAPRSGSAEQNGTTLSEQIGGQIFIDTWGLVNPCEPKRAADYGAAAASVSHDGNGIYGARFMCAAIAKAFMESEPMAIIEAGLAQIPAECDYRSVVQAVIRFYRQHPENWRNCFEMLAWDWGYDKYPGRCHIIPNAGVCTMALLYSEGAFDRGIEIATMAGWDTDCNAGNVGTILGVANGVEGLPRRYLDAINDGIVCSGISGYLNILDIPSFCRETALLGYRIAGERAVEELVRAYHPGEIYFDFALPGSTHAMCTSNPEKVKLCQSKEPTYGGEGALRISLSHMTGDERLKVYYKPFYTREDFSDERYSPVFSPTVYPGQTVSMKLYLAQWAQNELPEIAAYIRTCSDKAERIQSRLVLRRACWTDVVFTIPPATGDEIDEIGIIFHTTCETVDGVVYLNSFSVTGKASYTIDPRKQRMEFSSITPFSIDGGAWDLDGGTLNLMRLSPAFAYTGNYYASDYICTVPVTPHNGESHLLVGRSQGAQRMYMAGLGARGKAVIQKNDFGIETLAECKFDWSYEKTYRLEMRCIRDTITLVIDGKEILAVLDTSFSHGMFGCGSLAMGRTTFGEFLFSEEDCLK